MSQSTCPEKSMLSQYGPLYLILLGLIVFHAVTLPVQSLFVDECEEIEFTHEPLLDAVFMPDSMPPMFTLLLRAWLRVWQNDGAARMFSAFIGLLACAACYRSMLRLTDKRTAVVTTLVFACSPWQLYYAQLVRGYELMTLWAVLLIGSFWSMTTFNDKWSRRMFIAVTALGSYSHYYFPMVPVSLGTAWLLCGDRSRLREMIRTYAFIALLTLPVIVFLPSDFQYQHDIRAARPLSPAAAGYTYFSYFSGYALGPSQRDLQAGNLKRLILEAIPWAGVLGAALAMLALSGWKSLRRSPLTVPCLLMCTVPLVMIGGLGAATGITYNARFVVWFAMPMSVLIGLCFSAAGDRATMKSSDESDEPSRSKLSGWAVTGLTIILCVMATANFNRVFNPRYQFEDLRSTASYLREHAAAGSPVFVMADYISSPLEYYFGENDRIIPLPVPDRLSQMVTDDASLQAALAVVSRRLSQDGWLVVSRQFHADPDGLLLAALVKHGAVRVQSYAGVDIYRLPLGSPTNSSSAAGPESSSPDGSLPK